MNSSTERIPKRSYNELDTLGSRQRDIFVNNIPFNVSQAGLETALKRMFSKFPGYIAVKKVNLQKGIAFVSFDNEANAAVAVDANQNQSLGPRKIFVQLSDQGGSGGRRFDRENRMNEQRSDGTAGDTLPDAECWFCLANPSMETQNIFAMDESASVYLNAAKGPVTKFHSLLCPVTHFSCFAAASPEVRKLSSEYVNKYCSVFKREDFQVVYYERWIPLGSSAANHMQIHLIPVAKELSESLDWCSVMREKGKESDINFIRVTDHEDVVERMKGILGRVSYLFISFPGKKEADSRDNWLGLGKMNLQFPREIICTALRCSDRIDWQACQQEKNVQEEQVAFLKDKFIGGT